MTNKLFLVSATLAFFFLLTNASTYRTIVEFDENDANRALGPKERLCQKDFQESQQLRACQQWIHMRMQQGPLDLEDVIENTQQRHPVLQHCCHELHLESPVCVCPTLKEAARTVRLQGQHGPFQASRIFRTAKNLPNVCNIQQVGVCPFRTIPFFPPY